MAVQKAGRGLIITGMAEIALSLLIAAALAGREAAQPVWILGVEISAVFILLGVRLLLAETTRDRSICSEDCWSRTSRLITLGSTRH
ncbi:MAG: hypothetical protein WCC12_14000 [Anaerolineales bacterium]